jgi:hypothetical protein
MGSKPKLIPVPALPAPSPAAVAALPPAIMPPAAPQASPTAQAGNATTRAAALGASQGLNNTNLTGPRGIRFLEDQTQPRSLLGL